MLFVDARIPVVFGTLQDLLPADALLLDVGVPVPPGHAAASLGRPAMHLGGCLCCVPRGQAGDALGRLFQARGRGEVAFFNRVLAIVEDPEAIRSAVREDRLAAAWYRLA